MIINLYIMTRSVLLICFFILLLNEVFAKESVPTVQGFIGDSVVLQCHSEKPRGIQEKPDSNRGVESKAERIVSLLFHFFAVSILLCVL
ncbi:uncharacterized protein si:dkey-222p3.1 isoform X2 [Ctenopharyngodon idella]|uniref:uncharacterized protein si:dkey-222p3.1 isoform X2 n=1 Tax=Ctenopharyngodon idella TaxID=7959 RepID=UPI0022327AC0|nr:uncharacterized protein si:dkey-222p3.1 isoform X2 [Ctenopharyngodon idella]